MINWFSRPEKREIDYLKFALENIVISNSIGQMIAENSHVNARTWVSAICMIIQKLNMKTFRLNSSQIVEKIFHISSQL